MTRRDWIKLVGNSWKAAQLRAMVPTVPYDFWQFHSGIIGMGTRGIRFTIAAQRYGRDARRIAVTVRD